MGENDIESSDNSVARQSTAFRYTSALVIRMFALLVVLLLLPSFATVVTPFTMPLDLGVELIRAAIPFVAVTLVLMFFKK